MDLKKMINRNNLRRLFVYISVTVLPLAAKFFLHAALPVYLILTISAIKIVLVELNGAPIPGWIKKLCRITSVIYSCIFSLFLLIVTVITPLSAYVFFLEIVLESNKDSYFAANLFVMLLLFFSLFFGTSVLNTKSFKPFLGLAAMICGILLILYQTPAFFVLLIASLLAYIIVFFKKRTFSLAAAVIICGFLSGIIFFLAPKPGGSKLVDNFLFPEIRRVVIDKFPAVPLVLDIPGYGMGLGAKKLGGSTALSGTPIFEVTGGMQEALYIQTSVYDIYTGKSWAQSASEISMPLETTEQDVLSRAGNRPSINIKLLAEFFSMVPFTNDTVGYLYKKDWYEVENNRDWRGIFLPEYMKKNSRITLYRTHRNISPPMDLDMFLQRPGNLPQPVVDLAHNLGSNTTSKNEILSNIRSFLSSNFAYNLKAPVIKEDEDFLDKFLFRERWGYCTHFATAFAILARLNNIPARYVSGYLVYLSDSSNTKIVTARSAHAWPEVWLPGQGWVVREATRAVDLDYYEDYFSQMAEYLRQYYLTGDDIAENALTLQQLREMLGIEFRPRVEDKDNSRVWPGVVSFLRIAGFFLIIFLSIGGVILGIKRTLLLRDPDRKRKDLLDSICKTFKNIPPPEVSGWVAWKENLCRVYGIEEELGLRLLDVILKMVYGPRTISLSDYELLDKFKRWNSR